MCNIGALPKAIRTESRLLGLVVTTWSHHRIVFFPADADLVLCVKTALQELELVSRQENENYATELRPPEEVRWHIIENAEWDIWDMKNPTDQ